MHQVPSKPDQVVILGDFDAYRPEEIFDYFVKPDLIVQWWPKEAEIDPQVSGAYTLRWPEQGWTLRGRYLAFEAGRNISFTWNWDHEPGGEIEHVVDIWFEPFADQGTRIGIYHSGFKADEEGAADRQGVVEGWIHFLMILSGLRDGNATP